MMGKRRALLELAEVLPRCSFCTAPAHSEAGRHLRYACIDHRKQLLDEGEIVRELHWARGLYQALDVLLDATGGNTPLRDVLALARGRADRIAAEQKAPASTPDTGIESAAAVRMRLDVEAARLPAELQLPASPNDELCPGCPLCSDPIPP